LPLLFLFWANVHADFVIGLLVLTIFILIESVRQHKFWGPLFVWLASILATLINPYGFFLWWTLAREAGSSVMRENIAEWRPPNTHTDFGLYLLFFILLLTVLFFLRRRKPAPAETALVALFAFLSLFSAYHVRFLALVSAPFLVRGFASLSRRSFLPAHQQRFVELYASISLAVFALLVGPLFLGAKFWRESSSPEALAHAGDYPYAAVRYLKENPLKGNIFNEYAWGGYLIWQLPEVKTFIDGRMPAWQVDGESVFADYLAATRLEPGWEEVLQKYDISYFLLRADSSLAQLLRVHPSWRVIYEDATAIVFKREV
jgi:hypothetical protein